MSAHVLNFFKSYPEWKIFEIFKFVDNYWDCCVVGYVFHSLFTGAIDGVLFIITELLKFSFVLLLTYMLAQGIFYFWERQTTAGSQIPTNEPTSHRLSNNAYPHVVEIPLHISNNSLNAKKLQSPRTSVNERPLTVGEENQDAGNSGNQAET